VGALIARKEKPVARIVPIEKEEPREFGFDDGLGLIADDFNEPLSAELLNLNPSPQSVSVGGELMIDAATSRLRCEELSVIHLVVQVLSTQGQAACDASAVGH
jgi:hypothetical protein